MINYQFEKYARRNRAKAFFFTVTFHALLLGGLFAGSDVDVAEYIPETVQEWLGMDTEEAVADLPKDKQKAIRP